MMEDELGGGRPTTAADLVGLLTAVPRLLFVSACLTATGADASGHLPPGDGRKGEPGPGTGGLVAHSLATALVTAGIPAVIGWDGSVGDRSATVFAERLYRGLADRADLTVAVGDARRVLLESEDPRVRADWHLARLWLGPAGGGPLVAGARKRSLVTATRGTKTFLDRKQQVPVAAAQMFVGRRPELQQALRALRSGAAGWGAAARAGPAGQVQPGRPDRGPLPGPGGGGGVRRLLGAGHPRRDSRRGAHQPGRAAAARVPAAAGPPAAGRGRGGADGSAGRAVRPGG